MLFGEPFICTVPGPDYTNRRWWFWRFPLHHPLGYKSQSRWYKSPLQEYFAPLSPRSVQEEIIMDHRLDYGCWKYVRTFFTLHLGSTVPETRLIVYHRRCGHYFFQLRGNLSSMISRMFRKYSWHMFRFIPCRFRIILAVSVSVVWFTPFRPDKLWIRKPIRL